MTFLSLFSTAVTLVIVIIIITHNQNEHFIYSSIIYSNARDVEINIHLSMKLQILRDMLPRYN